MEYQWWLSTECNVPWAVVEDFFENEEIKKIIEIGLSPEMSTQTEAKLGFSGNKDEDYRKCNISWIRSDIEENQWIFRKLTDIINAINEQHFNFNIEMIQNLQFTEYTSSGDFYGKHLDIGFLETRPRKISFTIQLSEESDYDGGDLILYYDENGEIVNKKRGMLTAFPSYILHEVKPVTRGTRYALVGWVSGPKFK